MGFLPKNIFGNKKGDPQESQEQPKVGDLGPKIEDNKAEEQFKEAEEPPKVEDAPQQQVTPPLRVKPTTKKVKPVKKNKTPVQKTRQAEEGSVPAEIQLGDAPTTTTSLPPLTYYEFTIRRYYLDNCWYFSIEDLLPLAQYFEPHEDMEKLKKNDEFKKTFDKVVKEIKDSNYIVECLSFDGFMILLPMLRGENHIFPGPMPGWLEANSRFSSEGF